MGGSGAIGGMTAGRPPLGQGIRPSYDMMASNKERGIPHTKRIQRIVVDQTKGKR
jgi:hypothetical protein